MDEQVSIGLELWQGVVALCFQEMPRYYTGSPAAVVEWRLSGPGGGRWQLVLDGERCAVERDGARDPDVAFEAGAHDFVAVCLGQADPRRLALRGRIRPRGNLLLAARAAGWFAQPSPERP